MLNLPCRVSRGTTRGRICLRTARAGDWCQGRSCGGALSISPIGDQPDVHNVLRFEVCIFVLLDLFSNGFRGQLVTRA